MHSGETAVSDNCTVHQALAPFCTVQLMMKMPQC